MATVNKIISEVKNMGDLWNPFDANNPVYVKLAKEMKASRKRTRNGFLIVAVIGIMTLSPFVVDKALTFNGRVNQFGVIRRK